MLVLDRTQGVVGVPLDAAPVPGAAATPVQQRAPRTTQQQVAPQRGAPAAAAPQGAVVAEALEAAVAGLIPPAALAGRVGGALSAPGPSNPLAVFVAGLVDALPKQVGGSVDITAQLAGKALRLDALLEVLHQAGLLAELSPELLRYGGVAPGGITTCHHTAYEHISPPCTGCCLMLVSSWRLLQQCATWKTG